MNRIVAALFLLLLIVAPAVARPPVIEVTSPFIYDAEELTIAINPADPHRLAAGANMRYWFRSIDEGRHWTEGLIESSLGVWGDPCVVYDAEGNLYYAHLSFPPDGHWLDRIVVQKSTDDGLTWSDGVGVGLNGTKNQDKEWMATDRTGSIHHGNLYLSWTEFDAYGSTAAGDSSRILFARSTDRGESFSEPLRISDREGSGVDGDGATEGAVPAVGPDGQIYVAWAVDREIWFDRSLDGGLTFGADVFVADQPGGWWFDVDGIYRCNGLPVTACDVSDSPWRGRVYVMFSDQRNGPDDTDVFLCHSDDQGRNWSLPRRVNDDVGTAHQFFPWMTVDPATGRVTIVFYDRRGLDGVETDVWVARSDDGGATFENFRVSETPFVPYEGIFFGDYIGIDSWNGSAYAVWMRMDVRDLAVIGARLDPEPSGVADGAAGVQVARLFEAPANPVSRQTRIRFTLFDAAPVRLDVYDVRGRLVRSLVAGTRAAGTYTEAWDGADRGGAPVPSGMYLCRLQVGPDVVTRKVSIVR